MAFSKLLVRALVCCLAVLALKFANLTTGTEKLVRLFDCLFTFHNSLRLLLCRWPFEDA